MTKRRRSNSAPDDIITAALRVAFDGASEAMAVVAADGALIAVNAAFARMFGEHDSVSGLFITEAEAARVLAVLSGPVDATASHATMRRGGGQPLMAAISVMPAISGLLLTIAGDDDAGSLAASDAARRDSLERLAGGIAHDFRNVLAVIKGNVEIAERRSNDPRVKSLLIEAERAAALGAAMTDELLAFAQRRARPATQIDVAQALADFAPVLRAAAGRAVKLSIAAAPNAGCIGADATDLQRVMINLIANARDASPNGGAVTIAAGSLLLETPLRTLSGTLSPGRYVRIAVADEGVGMAAGVRRQAIDPFFTTKAPGQGFGLGLSLAHGFAADAGGGIDLDSTPGRGTTASLYLKAR